MTKPNRGSEREKNLKRETYFSDEYFSLPQLCSFAHQLNFIHSMRPKSVIEIGLGNGFVSSCLQRADVPVITVDINPALKPDICAPLSLVKSQIPCPQDLVVCCEVLEHMPLGELDSNLDYLRGLGDRLFLTLPNSYRSWGFSGFSFLPKLGARLFDFNIDFPYRRQITGGPHFWEVGSNSECTRAAIVNRLQKRYSQVGSGRFAFNPLHIWFSAE